MQDVESPGVHHLEHSKLESPAHVLHCKPECLVCNIDNKPEPLRHHPRCSWLQYARPYLETRLRFRSGLAMGLPLECVFFAVQLQFALIVFLLLGLQQSRQSILDLLPCGRTDCRVFRSRDPSHRTFDRREHSKDNCLIIVRPSMVRCKPSACIYIPSPLVSNTYNPRVSSVFKLTLTSSKPRAFV